MEFFLSILYACTIGHASLILKAAKRAIDSRRKGDSVGSYEDSKGQNLYP